MKSIDVFYQGEGITEIEHAEVEGTAAFAEVTARLKQKHGLSAETLAFLEDEDDPVAADAPMHKHAGAAGVKIHLHRCRQIETSVTFNGETVRHRFAPSATVARVKRWAAEKKFGMSEEEAGEHVLQIAGTHERPNPGVHIGALTPKGVCAVAFDLVPDERINGALVDRA